MDTTELQQRIEALEQWKAERERQQITFPLDIQSRIILGEHFMHILKTINYEVVGAAAHMISTYMGSQGTQNFELNPQTIFSYTANITTDTLTTTVNFANDTDVYLYTDDTYPAPFAVNTIYYVVNSTGNTFQLALTVGGAAINITTIGSGAQYITKVQ